MDNDKDDIADPSSSSPCDNNSTDNNKNNDNDSDTGSLVPDDMQQNANKETTTSKNETSSTSSSDSSEISEVRLKVKRITGEIYHVIITPDDTVASLKQKIFQFSPIKPSVQRLVFRGSLLDDDALLSSFNFDQNSVVFITTNVPAPPKTASSSATPAASDKSSTVQESSAETNTQLPDASASSTQTPAATTSADHLPFSASQQPNIFSATQNNSAAANPFSFDLRGLMDPNNRNMQGLNGMIDVLFNNAVDNPDFRRMMFNSNPFLSEMRERHPELSHLLDDPQIFRQCLELVRNPELMREMTRNADRAMSNIEAIPGGFNALRRMYHTFQEPIWNATVENSQNLAGANTSQTSPQSYELPTDLPPNSEALPNPWAPSAAPTPQTHQPPQFPPLPQQTLFRPAFPQFNAGNQANNRPVLPAAFPSMLQFQQGANNLNDLLSGRIPPRSNDAGNTETSESVETQYQAQLIALRDMGFTDTEKCVRALQQSGGNINRAIDQLLSDSLGESTGGN